MDTRCLIGLDTLNGVDSRSRISDGHSYLNKISDAKAEAEFVYY